MRLPTAEDMGAVASNYWTSDPPISGRVATAADELVGTEVVISLELLQVLMVEVLLRRNSCIHSQDLWVL